MSYDCANNDKGRCWACMPCRITSLESALAAERDRVWELRDFLQTYLDACDCGDCRWCDGWKFLKKEARRATEGNER